MRLTRAFTLGVCALMMLPVFYLLLRASEATSSTWSLILRDDTVALIGRSLGLALAVTIAAATIGVALAWLVMRTDLPGRRIWAVLVALPLVIPSYVGAFALIAALGPRGMLQGLLEGPFGIERLPDIGGFTGAFMALTLFTYPYVFLLVCAAIKGLDPSLEEAARSAGASRAEVFRRVTLPMLRPSITAGALLVSLYTLHDFGAVSLMRFGAFTQAIYLQYKGAFDRTPAAILSLILIAIAAVVLIAEQRARGRARYHRTGGGSKRPLAPIELGRWKPVAVAACSAVTLLAFVLPVSVVLYWFVKGSAVGREVAAPWGAAAGSLVSSGSAAIVALLCAAPVALVGRAGGRLGKVAEKLSYTGYALPGLVVALAFVFIASNAVPALYQSLPLVVIAYVVLFLPQAVEPMRTTLGQVKPSVEEAARALGSSKRRVFARVTAPLMTRGALAGACLVFLTAMKELPATLLLRPTGFETLATRVWTGASAGLYSSAAGPALLLIVLCAVPLYLLARRLEVARVSEMEVRAD